MAERYVQSKYRKKPHRGRRRRQKGNRQIFWVITGIVMVTALAVGFAWKASLAGTGVEAGSRTGGADMHTAADVQAAAVADHDIQDGLPQGTDTPWYLTLVNKENPIPEDYEPKLVKVRGGERVDERIYDPLMRMLEDAKEGNWYQMPDVVSGYRTEEQQRSLYNNKITEYTKAGYSENEAKELAEQWVAVPGCSEHQLGFAVDINGTTYDVYTWLKDNSYKYGFIFRYPGDKTHITGVAEEVWHYRYVGVEAATEMYEQGLCLEEYLSCDKRK